MWLLPVHVGNSEWQPPAVRFCQSDTFANSHGMSVYRERRFLPTFTQFVSECPALWHPDHISSQIGLAWPEAPNCGAHRGSSNHFFVNHTTGLQREMKQIATVGRALRIPRGADEFQANVVPTHAAVLPVH